MCVCVGGCTYFFYFHMMKLNSYYIRVLGLTYDPEDGTNKCSQNVGYIPKNWRRATTQKLWSNIFLVVIPCRSLGKCKVLERIRCLHFQVQSICVQNLFHCLYFSLLNFKRVYWPPDVPALYIPLYPLPKHICTLMYENKWQSISTLRTLLTSQAPSSTVVTSLFTKLLRSLLRPQRGLVAAELICCKDLELQPHKHSVTNRIR
jgi:hypothetical protein